MGDYEATVLIMEEARRQVEDQTAALNALRGMDATLLTGASVVTAVFGALLARQHRSGFSIGCEAIALALFVATVFASLVVLRPVDWKSEHSLENNFLPRLRENRIPDDVSVAATFAAMFDRYRKKNHNELKCLQKWFAAACLLLGVQVLAWGLAVL